MEPRLTAAAVLHDCICARTFLLSVLREIVRAMIFVVTCSASAPPQHE